MNLCLYLTARSVSVCFHDRMLALILRLDFPVSGGLVEDDHHARTLEDSVFCYLVAVSVHVTFVDRRRHTFYPCAPLHVCHVWRSASLAVPNSARGVFPQMLEVVCDWRSLYARHTVAKLGLIVLLRQASHFPVFDWLSANLKYFAQSMHVLSVATQVNLPFQCGTPVGLFLPSSMVCALWLPTRDGNGCW